MKDIDKGMVKHLQEKLHFDLDKLTVRASNVLSNMLSACEYGTIRLGSCPIKMRNCGKLTSAEIAGWLRSNGVEMECDKCTKKCPVKSAKPKQGSGINEGYGDDLPNALRLACKEWAHAHDMADLAVMIRQKHNYEYPRHTLLELEFVAQSLHWRAVVFGLSGNNYDFLNEVEAILDDDSFETELKELLVKFRYKKESIHERERK